MQPRLDPFYCLIWKDSDLLINKLLTNKELQEDQQHVGFLRQVIQPSLLYQHADDWPFKFNHENERLLQIDDNRAQNPSRLIHEENSDMFCRAQAKETNIERA